MSSANADAPTPVALFKDVLEDSGGQTHLAEGGEEVVAAIVEAAAAGETKRILYVPFELGSDLQLRERLAGAGIDTRLPEDAGRAVAEIPVAVTGAEMAVAETGTIIVGGTPGSWGLATVLPWVHVAVVRAGDVYADLSSAFEAFVPRLVAGEEDWVWITGPSRTADIGKTLVLGVHGPNSLRVVIVGEGDG